MCGIAGFAIDNSILSFDTEIVLDNMSNSMLHRGSDNIGKYQFFSTNFEIGLVHNRLSILDLSISGNQPYHYENLTLVFNGEIFNYKDFEKLLVGEGYSLDSSSDTEVLIKLWHLMGKKCLNLINGMFAFTIFDKNTNVFYLVRDRLGVKPLYYCLLQNSFAFASELKALRVFPEFSSDIDMKSIHSYFKFGFVNSYSSIFEVVRKLEAGMLLSYNIEEKTINKEEYWSLNNNTDTFIYSFDDLKNQFYEIIKSSIDLRFVSDLPVGIFLSSGLDSTLVSKIALNNNNVRVLESLTLKSEDYVPNDVLNDSRLHKKFYEFKIDDAWTAFNFITPMADEPFADSALIGLYLLSKNANNSGLKVVLVGDGGDELLAGYGSSKIYARSLYQNVKLWKFFRFIYKPFSMIVDKLLRKIIVYSKVQSLVVYHAVLTGKNMFEMTIISENILQDFANKCLNVNLKSSVPDPKGNNDILNMLNHKTKSELIHQLNYKTDLAGMINTIEIREPLLDYRLFELQQKIDKTLFQEMLVNNNSKILFNVIMAEDLNLDVSKLKKTGFHIGYKSMINENKKEIGYYFMNFESKLINRRYVRRLWRLYNYGLVNEYFIYRILVFLIWESKVLSNNN
ncbi:MAG TPA: asparagine synthase (glutamine-hydrolyzing) [Chitinophagaceae bacterium]|nr:asparagine synthase (glutamine-hydrolyzing) [Chitinophagaceae bacterium]